MNITVRNMIYGDIEDLSHAFAEQGWIMPAPIFEHCYSRMLRRYCDVLVAETRDGLAGFMRLEWVDAGESAGHALMPEIQEFIVLGKYTGAGVADAICEEANRRIASKTGEIVENALMTVYGMLGGGPDRKRSYVLDGLLVSNDGKFVRSKGASAPGEGTVISIASARRS